MDVLGSLGYQGQEITFLDADNFAYATGTCLCVVDVASGPKDFLWRPEGGIRKIVSNILTRRYAVIPEMSGRPIEIMSFPGQKTESVLQNPAASSIADASFYRNGERLVAISDVMDRKYICWNVQNGQTLFSFDLDRTFFKLQLNPANDLQVLFHGVDGLFVGTSNEVLGDFSFKQRELMFFEATQNSEALPDQISDICFAIWAPFNRIFVGTKSFSFYDADVNVFKARKLGNFETPEKAFLHDACVPTCAVLSGDNLVIGCSNGASLWFHTAQLTSSVSPDLSFLPGQISYNSGSVSGMYIDPKFEKIFASSVTGMITKLPVEVLEKPKSVNDGEDDQQAVDDVEREIEAVPDVPIVVKGDRYLAFQHGATLCSASISLPIIGATAAQVTKRTTNLVSIFVTGSHAGSVSFWKQPIFDSDVANAPGVLGIRKSVPRVMKSLLTSEISEASKPCTLLALPSTVRDGSCLLAVGSSTGWIEIWKLFAYECEEDEEESGNGGAGGEEDGIQLNKTVVFRQRLYNGALSLISLAANTIQSKGDPFALAVGSFFDHRVYILRKDARDNYSVCSFFCVGASDSPTALTWTGSALWIATQSGSVYSCGASFLLENPPNVSTSGEMMIEKTVVADFSSISAGVHILRKCMLAVSVNSPTVYCVDETDGDTVDAYVSFGAKQHTDVVICCALSPNKTYVATGCADGSVYIWALHIDDADKASWSFEVVCKFRFHTDAVVSLTFGQDSSQLCSSAVDGSCFLYTVGKPTKLLYEFDSASQSVRTSVSHTAKNEGTVADSDENVWLDTKKLELVRNLKDSYKEKSSEVRAAVNDIKFQLKRLLDRNAARSELERMERGEFVVDVARKNLMQADSVALAQKIRETYSLRLYWNELSAARLRAVCWDSMDLHSRSILPFVPSSCGDVKSVSSYSVPRLSDAEQIILDKVKRLRAIEIRSQKFHGMGAVQRLPEGKSKVCWSNTTQGISSNISWVLNDGFKWPCTDIVETINKRDLQAAEVTKDKAGDKKDSAAVADGAVAAGTTADDDDDRSLSSQDNANFEFDDGDIFNLLYPPQAIRSQVQKRSYIVLLKEVIRVNKRKFNDHFEKLAREKDDVFASVESRNDRIESILKELNQLETFPRPRRADVEIAGSAVFVRDEEVESKLYETEAMRQQRLKEEEEKRRRDEEKDKDDIMGRALDDMMHGTLEVKRDIFAEASAMQKPAWMEEISPSEMDEAQLREYEAFEVKFKALQDEQLAYRKQLELELKKLKGEVVEACKMFDEKLVSMARLKLLTQREILAQELYIARIAHSVVIGEQSWRNLKSLVGGMDKTRKERGELRGKIDRLSAQCEEVKVKLNAIQEDERSMDKSFKRDIQALCNTTFDQDTLKVLTQLFRLRSYPNEDGDASSDNGGNGDLAATDANAKGATRGSKGGSSKAKGRSNQASGNAKKSQAGSSALPEKKGGGGNKMKASKVGMSSAGVKDRHLGPMQAAAQALTDIDIPSYAEKDPFFMAILQQERLKRSSEIPLPLLLPLSMDSDCPEGFNVSQFTWSKLQELRNARIEKEIEGKTMAMKYNDVKAQLDLLHVEEAAFVGSMNSLRSSKDETLEELKTLESDLEVVVNVRQGQDEIDKDAIVTDYGDAALIPTAVLDKFNSRIKELGKDKIGILSKIKHFRRKINLVDWEAQHLSLESNHFEEYFTDLQLFRVTRKLQQVIRDGADSEQAKERLDKISLRKDFMQKDADGKLFKMKKAKDALRKQYVERNEENGMLEKKIRELKTQVAARRNVRQSRDDARGATSDSAGLTNKKMKKIVLRRHLVDTARAQAEEIDFLRQELDKIRQKTFPSFIRAVKKRLPNPDEF